MGNADTGPTSYVPEALRTLRVIVLPAYGPQDARMLRSHLSLVHGMYVNDVKTEDGLLIAHEDSHSDPDPHFVLNHRHDAEPEVEEIEVWKW